MWGISVALGFAIWHAAEAKPGRAGTPTAESSGERRGPLAAVYVHPHCPCTRGALPAFVAAVPPGIDLRVLFVRPPGVSANWERSRSWEIADAAPGVTLGVDIDGAAAIADGAETSGHLVVRDAAGRVRFRGGIGRAGMQALADIAAGREPGVSEADVFGCPLLSGE